MNPGRFGRGRTIEEARHAGELIFAAATRHLVDLPVEPHFALSLEVREIDPALSWRSNLFLQSPKRPDTAFWVPTPLNIIDLLDLMATAGWVSNIERGPGRHGISNAFFLYIRDPDGHRIELYCSDDQTADPDLEPIKWDLKDPQRQTLWGERRRLPGLTRATARRFCKAFPPKPPGPCKSEYCPPPKNDGQIRGIGFLTEDLHPLLLAGLPGARKTAFRAAKEMRDGI